jgi:hypothetical protein
MTVNAPNGLVLLYFCVAWAVIERVNTYEFVVFILRVSLPVPTELTVEPLMRLVGFGQGFVYLPG